MTSRPRRNRVVLFRLTEQEHHALEELCASRGGRSLSEFVRVEVLTPAFSSNLEPLQELVVSLERRLSSLQKMYEELDRRVQGLKINEPAKSSSALAGGEV